MSEVALRDYITEIDGMIEHNAYDTAIAHCRHILTQYPRYLEVYRTLGKAALEKEDDEAALDIFQRVLSVDPEDFVARVGLSIIYDRSNDLSKAIWHMERAFDLMPSNEVIQSELKRLYGRRDGTEPERISLTRGALARMYAQGGLYPEAIADLHSLLQEQSDRIDLQVLLAEVLWRDEQQVEAAEWAQKVIAKLPYCLKANLVLGDVWQSNGQSEEGLASLKRAQAVDPDNVRAAHLFGSASPLPYQTTIISHMDQPSYGEMLTDTMPRIETEEVPDWLKGLADLSTPEIEAPESMSAPRLPTGLHMPGTGPLQGEIPEWLQGLAPTAEPGVEAAEPAAEVPDWLVAMTGPATGEAQPDWMTQLQSTPEPTAESTVAPEPSAAEMPDWLSQLGASAEVETAQPTAPEEVPDWLSQLSAGVAKPAEPAAQAPAETSDWMSQLRGAAPVEPEPEAAASVPDWLSQLQASAPSLPETEATLPVSTPEAEVPDWLAGLQTSAPEPTTPAVESKEEVPDWLQSLQTLEKQAQATVVSPHPSVLEHKIELDADRETVNRLVEAFETKGERPAAPAEIVPAASVAEVPEAMPGADEAMPSADDALAFLTRLSAGKEDQLRAQAEQEAAVRMDAIMGRKPAQAAPTTPPAPIAPEPAPAVPEAMPSADDALAFLTRLSAGKEDQLRAQAEQEAAVRMDAIMGRKPAEAAPVAPEPEPIVAPAPEAEVPDWLSQLTTQPVEEVAEPTPSTELPEWLRGLQPPEQMAVEEPAVVDSVAEPTPSIELPERRQDLQSPEQIEQIAAEEPAVVESVAAPTPSTELPEWLRDLQPPEQIEQMAAEETAVVESVAEPTLSTELPEWLREVQAQETIAEPAAASELPEWLRELQPLPSEVEPVAEETAAVESAAVVVPAASSGMLEGEEPLAYLQRLADEKQAQLSGAVQPQVSEIKVAPAVTPAPPVAETPAAPVAATTVAAEAAVSVPEAMPSADDALAFFARLSAGKEDQLRAQAEQEAAVRMDAIMGRKSAEVLPAAPVSKPEPEPQPEAKPIEAAPVAAPVESAPAAEVPVAPPVEVKPAAPRVAPKPVAVPAAEIKPAVPVVEPKPTAPPPAEMQPVASVAEVEPPSTLPASWWIQSAEDEGEEPMAELPAPYLAPRPAPSGPTTSRLKRDRGKTRELTLPAVPASPPTPAVIPVNLEPLLVRLQYNKNDHDARLQLARAYWAMGDRDQSLETYTKLAAANVMTEDLMADLERVVEIYQDADWFRLLGDVYMKNSRLPRALDMYRRALTQL